MLFLKLFHLAYYLFLDRLQTKIKLFLMYAYAMYHDSSWRYS
jgi:hypothetical protein